MSEPNWDDRPEHEYEEDPTEAGLTEADDQAEAEDESADFIHDQALAQAADQTAALVTPPLSAESAAGSGEDADQDETGNDDEDEAARVSAKDRALKAAGAAGVLAKTLGAKLGPVALQAGRLTARGAKAGAGLAYHYPRAAIATGLSGAILSGVLFLQPSRDGTALTNQIKNGAKAGERQTPGSTPDDPPQNKPSVADRDKKPAKENDPAKPTDSVDPPLPEGLASNAKGNTPPASDPPPVPSVDRKNEKPDEDADLLAAADAGDSLAPSPVAPLSGDSLENDELPSRPSVKPVKLAGGDGQANPGLDSLAPVMDPAPAPAPSPTLAQTDASKADPLSVDKPAPLPVSAAAVEGTLKSAAAPEPIPSIEEALTHDDKLPGVDLPEPDLADLTSAEPTEKVAASSSPVPPKTPGDAKTPDDPGNKSAGSLAPAVSKLAKDAGIAGGLGLALGAAANTIANAADHHDDKKAEEKPPVKPAADLPHEDVPTTPTPAPAPSPVLADEPRSLELDQNKLSHETPASVLAPATIAGLDEEPEETPGNARINGGAAPAPLPDAGPKTAQADAGSAPGAGNETASGNPASLHDQLAREGWVPIKHAGASAPRDLQQRDIGADNEVVASEPKYRDASGEIDAPIRFEVETQPGRNLARDAAIGATAAASGAAVAGSGDRRNASPPEGKLETVLHRVEANENFWTISRLYYNSGRYYRALWQANKEKVPQIDKLYQDTVIRIPPPEDLDTAYIDPPGARPPVAGANPKTSKDGETRQAARTQAQAAPSGGVPIRRSSRAEAELSLPVVGLADDDEFESRGSGRQQAISNDRRSQPIDNEPEDQPRREEAPTRPIYKVRPNDTLRSIARDTLGEARRADEILNLNREIIDDPRQLIVGQILELPDDAHAPRARRR